MKHEDNKSFTLFNNVSGQITLYFSSIVCSDNGNQISAHYWENRTFPLMSKGNCTKLQNPDLSGIYDSLIIAM